MYNRNSRSDRGRRPEPQPRTLVVRSTAGHNAQLILEGGLQLNIHLLHRKRELFKGETSGFQQKTVFLENNPFDTERWYEILVTLTRTRLPGEIVKRRHLKLLEKGKQALIKVCKPFRFDPRHDHRTVPEAFKAWLKEQNLPESLYGEVETIVLNWVPKKKD